MKFNFAGITANSTTQLDLRYTTKPYSWSHLSINKEFKFYLIFGVESTEKSITKSLTRKKYKKTKENLNSKI